MMHDDDEGVPYNGMRESRYIELEQYKKHECMSLVSFNARSINNKFGARIRPPITQLKAITHQNSRCVKATQ